jgi:calcium/calmodulin-dependent protein kinase I
MPRSQSQVRAGVSSTSAKAEKSEPSFHDKYRVGSKIGKGSFGQVYNAFLADGGHVRAVKISDFRSSTDSRRHKVVQNEISIWSQVKEQPHCVHLYEVFKDDGLCYLVMEKCNSTILSHLDSKGDDLDERCLGEMFAQMLMGIKELHALGVVHADIKPDNFLCGGENGNTIKLGDFGLARRVNTLDGKVKGECGTAPYMCPEMIASQKYDEKADIWSLGVIVYVLLFGRFPYTPAKKSTSAMKMAILNNATRPNFGSSISLSSSALAFSMRLLSRDPAGRPSALDALKMTYMFAAMTQSHKVGEILPSLRPTLLLAVKAHAFENRSLASDELDEVLDMLQVKKLGTRSPEDLQRHDRSRTSSFTSLKKRSPSSSVSTRSSMHAIGSPQISAELASWRVHAIGSPQLSAELTSWRGSFTNEGSWTCSL